MGDRDLRIRISDMLKHMGVPAGTMGYSALSEAIFRACNNPELLKYITKGLYSEVADALNTTPARADRTIRHSVERCFDIGDPDVLEQYFGFSVDSQKGKPCNKQFIATAVEWLMLERDR